MGTDDPVVARALMEELVGGYRLTQMIYVVAELGIVDRLEAAGAQDAAALAAACDAHAPSLYRVLRGLAGAGIFREDECGRFIATEAGRLLLSDRPDSLRPWVIDYGQPWWWQPWGRLLDTVRSGETAFAAVHAREFFDWLRAHPEELARFNAHMTAMTAATAAAVGERCDLAGVKRVVDVAGGHGGLLAALLAREPQLQGVLFDLPEVVAGAGGVLQARGVAGRVRCVGGSFFEAVPGGGDLYLLKDIVHDWDDERALAILCNCRAAMGPQARLLLVERVIEPGNGPSPAKLLDISMMVITGGRERSAADYRVLLAAADLRLTGITPTRSAHSLMEAVPA
jgi:hypothetical protein